MAANQAYSQTGYEGELAGNILLEDGEDMSQQGMWSSMGGYGGGYAPYGDQSYFGAQFNDHSYQSLSPVNGDLANFSASGHGMQRTGGGELPARTPSPVYQWNHPKKVSVSDDVDGSEAATGAVEQGVDSGGSFGYGAGLDDMGNVSAAFEQMSSQFFNPYWANEGLNAQAYYDMMMQGSAFNSHGEVNAASESGGGQLDAFVGGGRSEATHGPAFSQWGSGGGQSTIKKPTGPQGPPLEYMQMMMAMQAMQQAQGSAAIFGKGKGMPSASTAASKARGNESAPSRNSGGSSSRNPDSSSLAAHAALGKGGTSAPSEEKGKKSRKGSNRDVKDQAASLAQRTPLAEAPVVRERESKGKGKKHGSGVLAVSSEIGEQPKSGKFSKDSRPPSSPLIEQLKSEKNVELSDLMKNIADIAQDQYGSRLIQQKLEVASEEEKQRVFRAVLFAMPLLTTDVFGNYVIQKFFEHGTAEQRRILAEQLVGKVLKLSHQMYGCRVVQKALDSVPIEQQVLLIGELKGHVLSCIEDEHCNHVIQKCIERMPTDKINFIVESFDGQATRMAKHCYGCRVIQRLIEYCSSQQITSLLEQVLHNIMDLATDQYGNYVVQHVMEHSTRHGDRESVLRITCENVNHLSCHKYASNVVEKALQCGTAEERGSIISAIVGAPLVTHSPLLNMMRDRFGNYIVQRAIGVAQSPQRELLIAKLQDHMPQLKKSSTFGKHIISALERAQAQSSPS